MRQALKGRVVPEGNLARESYLVLASEVVIGIIRLRAQGYVPWADNLTLAVRCYLTVK